MKKKIEMALENKTQTLSSLDQKRIDSERLGLGPLEPLLADLDINEILVNQYDQIFFEKNGLLKQHDDQFLSEHSYLGALDRLTQKAGKQLNREKPFLEIKLEGLRYTLVFSEIANGTSLLSIRRPSKNRLTFHDLASQAWAAPKAFTSLKALISEKKNILVVGSTSSGKTTLLQVLIDNINQNERAVIIEDTEELRKPNIASVSLLTRSFINEQIQEVTLEDLVKRSLRLRPDRLVLGEVRGPEAYALLLALSTGHRGSLSSLHAENAKQALLRLEMLVQLGAPNWSLSSIRRLITLSLDIVIVVEKTLHGRCLKEICELKSVEEGGITLERLV